MSDWSPGSYPSGDYTAPPVSHLPYQFADRLISPNYNGWWTRGLSIARRGWKPLVALQAVGVIVGLVIQAPVAAYAAIVTAQMTRTIESSGQATAPDLAPLFGLLGFGLLTVLLAVIVTALITVASVHVGLTVALGAGPRVADALALALRRVFPFIGWQLLAVPIYLIALCLCVLPVLYVAAVFTVLPVVVAAERTNAVSRCFALFHRDLGTAVSRTATILGIALGAGLLGGLIGAGIDAALRSGMPGTTGVVGGAVGSTLVGTLVSGAVAILLAPLTLTAYADMRARVEPHLTTMHIAADLGLPAPTPAPQPWPAGPPATPPAPPPPPPPASPSWPVDPPTTPTVPPN
jgi:hypothetical protein